MEKDVGSVSSSMRCKRKFTEGNSSIMKDAGGAKLLPIKGNLKIINTQVMVDTFVKINFMLGVF